MPTATTAPAAPGDGMHSNPQKLPSQVAVERAVSHLLFQLACPSTAARAPSAAHQRLRRATRPTRSLRSSAT